MNRARWIKSPEISTIPCFRKNLSLRGEINKAILKITSMGYYRVFIDEKDITSNLFMPGWTSYKNRVQFQEYDITHLLSATSKLDILLAEGWGGSTALRDVPWG